MCVINEYFPRALKVDKKGEKTCARNELRGALSLENSPS